MSHSTAVGGWAGIATKLLPEIDLSGTLLDAATGTWNGLDADIELFIDR